MIRSVLLGVLLWLVAPAVFSQAVPKKFIPKKAEKKPAPRTVPPVVPVTAEVPRRATSDPVSSARKAARPASNQKFEPIFAANDDCELEIDGEPAGTLKRNEPRMIVLSAGSHRVKATSINGDETFSATFNIIGNSQLVSIPFREVSEVALVPEPYLDYFPVSFSPVDLRDTSFNVEVIPAVTEVPDYVSNSSLLMVVHDLSANMIQLPGGRFDNGDMRPNSGIVWKDSVTISAFRFGKYEVTQRQWQQVMGYNNSVNKDCSDCPVENISWNEVNEFLRILNATSSAKFRLPTNAEWEFAVRMDVREYIDKRGGFKYGDFVAWHEKNAGRKTHPIGSKIPHRSGAHDLMGNVSEWCADWYDPNYSQYNKVLINPVGPATGTRKVVRGGSFANSDFVKSDFLNPMEKQKTVGFRLVQIH